MIYLDNAATTKISDGAIQAMEPYLNEMYGNPSGIYNFAKMSKELVEETRKNIAGAINGKPEKIFFTSGGTESDNWVLENAKNYGNHIITSKIEHHAILNKCEQLEKQGMKVTYLNVDNQGVVNPRDVEKSIRSDTALISIMFANNEIGTTEPIAEIGEIARNYNVIFHTDAVQAFGHVPIDVEKMNIDMMSASGHKFHGPKGVGFLYIRNPEQMMPLVYGGGQEKGKRSGTENVAGIAGMNGAVCEMTKDLQERMKKETNLRNYLINRVLSEIPYVRLNGNSIKRLPGNANFTIAGIDGTSLVVLMDNDGICISSGSACSSGSDKPSHVISAIGVPENYAYGTIRITLCGENTKEEIDYTIHRLKENVRMLRSK
ncbi:cysteine desulfurase family protein [uncultured Eubacterium sp.]|uniref:cysteine desulfurase family protein n=1 Tax=uncultured Eubacterium sp. TaxID=165185 RepID=UPI002670EAF9|nr:cysteine desulfurase family protein [uncultured Eubacterium sp.]